MGFDRALNLDQITIFGRNRFCVLRREPGIHCSPARIEMLRIAENKPLLLDIQLILDGPELQSRHGRCRCFKAHAYPSCQVRVATPVALKELPTRTAKPPVRQGANVTIWKAIDRPFSNKGCATDMPTHPG